MAQQASKSVTLERIDADAPMFDPKAFRLGDEQAEIIARARELAQSVFAAPAAGKNRDAIFSTENYQDLPRAGLLGIAIQKKHGGLGSDYKPYSVAAAEI